MTDPPVVSGKISTTPDIEQSNGLFRGFYTEFAPGSCHLKVLEPPGHVERNGWICKEVDEWLGASWLRGAKTVMIFAKGQGGECRIREDQDAEVLVFL